MGVTAVNEFITTEELQALAEIALAPKIMEGITPLDQITYPTFDALMAKSPKGEIQSVQGAYRFEVKGTRPQRVNYYDGAQKLKFEGHFTPFHLDFDVGKGHFGDLLVIDVVERAGIKVNYSQELRQGGVSREKQNVVLDILRTNKDDIDRAIKLDTARRALTANFDSPKCFSGLDALLPVTSNSSGTIGKVSRALPILRHQLITGVTGDTVQVAFGQMERLLEDGSAGEGDANLIVCGDNWFDLLVDLYGGTTTRPGRTRIEINSAQAKDRALADKFQVGFPMDSFVGPNGQLIVRDPLFRKLDGWENPAVLWANRMYFLNLNHLMFVTEKHNEMINHGMPYDQRVNYSSTHNAGALCLKAPASCGVMIKA
jgi:hypothetical protein